MSTIIPGTCGSLMKLAVDKLTDESKKDRQAVFNALGEGIEKYIETVFATLILMPVPGLGTIVLPPGSPTAPGPAPVPIGLFLK